MSEGEWAKELVKQETEYDFLNQFIKRKLTLKENNIQDSGRSVHSHLQSNNFGSNSD